MPQIKTESSKNKTVYVTADGKYRWEPYKDKKLIQLVQAAFQEIDKKVIGNKTILKTCNVAFSKLKGRRDFASVWKDPRVWISYNPSPEEGLYGMFHKDDISIAAYVFTIRDPIRWIAGTLIHELAHFNGAPGGWTDSKEAEATLPPCGFDDIYNPATIGMIRRPMDVYVA
jgi:hypothetical protein